MIDPATPPSELDKAFWKFHDENPDVFEMLVKLTRQAKEKGRKKIGIAMLFEVMRWNRMIQTSGDTFKLNNNYKARYVRLLEEKHPDLVGMFETRTLRSNA